MIDKKLRKKLMLLVIAILMTCVVVAAGVYYFYKYRYNMTVSYHMPSLAAALSLYYDKYGALPDKLETIESEGMYPEVAYRLPCNIWEMGKKHTGPAPYYLPVQNWDKKTPYIIAVEGKLAKGSKGRRYVIMLETQIWSTSDDRELAELLRIDDQLRDKTGQVGHWDDVPWGK